VLLLRKLKQLDVIIVLILLVLMLISTLLVQSAMLYNTRFEIPLWKILLIDGVGLLAFIGCSLFDYRLLLRIWPYLYGLGIALLLGVFFFAGVKNGAKGWFQLPFGLDFQPAEFMKFVLIISIAAWIGKRNGERLSFKSDVLPTGLLVFFAFVIVMAMPDMGNAAIYLVILIGMYWIGNIKYTHVLIGIVAIVVLLGSAYFIYDTYYDAIHEAVKPVGEEKGSKFYHWIGRIDAFLYPETASKDDTYQIDKALLAIGSGGLTGEGYMQGALIRQVPYTYSDSIFAVVGEEFGFRGSAILLLLFFVMIYRMILIAIQTPERSGAYIIIGIVSMFVLQIFQNVGMLINVMPLTGITLPFISYGGTSQIINMIGMGFVMSVKIHQDHQPFEGS